MSTRNPTDRFSTTPDEASAYADESYAGEGADGGVSSDGRHMGEDAVKDLLGESSVLSEYARHYMAAMLDAKKAKARDLAINAGLGAVGFVILSAVLATCVVLTLVGIAGAISDAIGIGAWTGQLIIGVSLLLLFALAVWLGLRWMRKAQAKAAREKYEQLRQQQREKFGHDVFTHPRAPA